MTLDTLTRPGEKYYPAIANIFSPSVITNLIKTGKSKYLSEVLSESRILDKLDSETTMYDFFDWIFNFISQEYRSEYVYKNVIANKILRGELFLDLSYILTELDAGKCKADVVVLNGTSAVYEIKSEYDSLDRIHRQISEYKKIFDKVNVITCETQAMKLKKILSEDIGLIILTSSEEFIVVQDAKSNKINVLPDVIFDSLRKNEYLDIIEQYFGFVPDVPNTLVYTVCKNIFRQLPPGIAHDEMVSMLSQRREARRLRDYFNDFPQSLTAYIISHNMNGFQSKKLSSMLKYSLREIIDDKQTRR